MQILLQLTQVNIFFPLTPLILYDQNKKKILEEMQFQKLTLYMAPVPNFHFLHSLINLLSVPWKKQIICFCIYYSIFWKFTALSKRQENAS